MSPPADEPDADADDASRAPRTERLAELARRIGHDFEDLGLLDRALVHASMGNDGLPSYERLEFLGDAVLGFIVSDHLFRDRPDSVTEGELTDLRSRSVSRAPLAEVAQRLKLIDHLLIGRGMQDRDLESRRIQADLVEAVLGAVYVDGGIRAAKRFVRKHVLAEQPTGRGARQHDAKTRLLHLVQSRGLGQPVYELVREEGPSHERHFTFVCLVAGKRYGQGSGPTKRKAQTEAAARTLEMLQREDRAGGTAGGAEA